MDGETVSHKFVATLGLAVGGLSLSTIGCGVILVSVMSMSSGEASTPAIIVGGLMLLTGMALLVALALRVSRRSA